MTAKLVLETRYKRKDNLFPIVIRIRSGNQMKQVPCGYYVPEKAWGKGEVKKNYRDADIINADILKQLAEMTTKIRMAKSEGITDINMVLRDKPKEEEAALLFSDYLKSRATQYDEEKKIKHARKVRSWLYNLQECFNTEKLPTNITEDQKKKIIDKVPVPFELNADDMRKFNVYLKNTGNAANTINDKFAKLGQLFDSAIKERKTNAENVFERFNAPKKPVHKEKLTKEEIAAIEQLQLSKGSLDDTRNLFLFSYYCKGMRFEDCIRVKRSDIVKNRIIFREIRKGKSRITVQVHEKLKQLIEPYLVNDTPYLFPFLKFELLIDKTGILTEEAEKERIKYVESQNVIVNRNLKIVALSAGITKEVTAHVSRHSFAYNMKKQGANINIIKDALGHGDTKITERYLAQLDDEVIDEEVNKLYE